MRKTVVILIIVVMLIIPFSALAEESADTAEDTPQEQTPAQDNAAGFDDSEYNTESYVLLDMESGEVLHSKNADQRIYPASTTKLMTALLLIEQKGLEGEVTVGNELMGLPSGSSMMGIVQGEKVSVRDLFYGLMVVSGNDAANAIAVHVSGSVDAFCDLMNARAKELGMENTNFNNPHGVYFNQYPEDPLPEEKLGYNHYSTAADMAVLAREAAKHPEIVEAAQTTTYTPNATNKHSEWQKMENSNRLIYTPEKKPDDYIYIYEPANGMKTGLIANIQQSEDTLIPWYGCLVASAEKDGTSLIAVMFGDRSERGTERWGLAKSLFSYGFEQFAKIDIGSLLSTYHCEEQLSNYSEHDIGQGVLSLSAALPADAAQTMIVDKATAEGIANGSINVETVVTYNRDLSAPVAMGEEMGTVSYMLNGQELFAVPLIADRQVYEAGMQEQTQPGEETEEENSETKSGATPWWVWLFIPAGIFAALLIIRAVNISRRKKRRRARAMRNNARYIGNDADALRSADRSKYRRRL